MNKKYINSDGRVFQGQEADNLFQKKNDLNFLTAEGVIKVSKNRWEEAQKYELKFMTERCLSQADDRNIEHYNRFDSYKSINDMNVGNYIELGCGPFTNSRLILPKFKSIQNVYLLDPLMNSCIRHNNCSYKNGILCNYKVNTVCNTIEDANFKIKFDVIVLINVLEHCYDIQLIFNKIYDLLCDNGILIFSEATIAQNNIKDIVNSMYDEGHAIRLSREYIKDILDKYTKISYNEYSGLYNQPWRQDIYFIGRK